MKTYLLLRNNKQMGPHTLDELLNMGLKPHDLIWVEGKSSAWRYPSELDEFKSQLSAPADLAADLPFTQVQNDVLLYMNAPQAEDPEDQGDELNEFPTLALFMKDMSEPRIEAQPRIEATDAAGMEALLEPIQQGETASPATELPKEEPRPSKIMVTLPAARTESKLVLIHPREDAVITKPDLPAASQEGFSLPAEPVETVTRAAETEKPISPTAEPPENIPFSAGSEKPMSPAVKPPEVIPSFAGTEKSIPKQTVSAPVNWLPRIAVAAAVASLLAVTALVAYSIFGPDPYQLSKPVQVSRGTAQKRLETASATPVADTFNTTVSSTASTLSSDPSSFEQKPAVQKTSTNSKPDPRPSNAPAETVNKTAEAGPALPIEAAMSAKESVSDAKAETRNNISKLVSFRMGYYKANMLGGVSAFEVVLINGTAYPLDKVEMELEYILSNGKTYKTETISFQGIAPGGSQTIGVPKSSRGVKVLPAIRFIESRELDLSYRQ